jgi:TonB family protein
MIPRSVDKRLFFSGIAAGILHVIAVCAAFYIVVQGLQKSQEIIQIYIASGSSKTGSESLSNGKRHDVSPIKPVAPASPLYEEKAKDTTVSGNVRELSPAAEAAGVKFADNRHKTNLEKAPATGSGKADVLPFGSASGPNFLRREVPVYPFMARRMNKEGKVLLKLTIDEKGKLMNVEVIEAAGFGFTEAALEAVRKSTYRPAIKNGSAVLSLALLPVRFQLTHQQGEGL